MRTIAVVNLKGGSGKTTTALNLAVGSAGRKRRVLLIDADPQANASLTLLDGATAEEPTLSQVLLDQAAARRGDPSLPSQTRSTSCPPMPGWPTPPSCWPSSSAASGGYDRRCTTSRTTMTWSSSTPHRS